MLIYRTAGGGGWKDRLDRPVEAVERDVAFGLVSAEKALSAYGVVVGDADGDGGRAGAPEGRARRRAGVRLRAAAGRGARACEAETGLPAPVPAKPLRWSPLERPRVGAGARRAWLSDFGGAAGFGERPAVVVVDLNLGFTDPASPLACDLDDVLATHVYVARRGAAWRACRCSSPRSSTTRSVRPRRPSSCARCRRCGCCRPGTRWVEIDPRLGRLAGGAGASPRRTPPRSSACRLAAMLAGRDTLIVCVARRPPAACARPSSSAPASRPSAARAGVRLRPAAGRGARALRGGDRAPGAGAGEAAPLVDRSEDARVVRSARVAATRAESASFGGAAGFGERPAVVVVDLNLGFTDPSSPLACDLDDVLRTHFYVARRGPRRRTCPCSSPRSSTTRSARPRPRSSCARCPALRLCAPGTRWVEIDPRLGPPARREPILAKAHASAFFGVPFAAHARGPRHADRVRRVDLRLRPRDRRRRDAARPLADRATRVRRRPLIACSRAGARRHRAAATATCVASRR